MIFRQNLREEVHAKIPPLAPKPAAKPSRPTDQLARFDPSRISGQDYRDFITFVEGVMNTPCQHQGLVRPNFSLENALEVLHKSNYSVSRAKFWIQFPILYQYEHQADPQGGKLSTHREMLSKRQRLADLPDEDLDQYFQDYYEGLRKNKSNAERLWMAQVAKYLSQDEKLGREARRLYNDGVFSKFEGNYDLKQFYDLENKLSSEVEVLLSQPEKDGLEISKLYKKCLEQSFLPSNFEKLEAAFLAVQAVNEEVKESTDQVIHINYLKQLHDKLAGYRKTPEYKAVIDRYNKASSLKSAMSNFWKTQMYKTRGGVAEEKFDISKGMEMLKQSESLKVELDNTDKFRERITTIFNLLAEIERFLASKDDEKSLQQVIDYSTRLSEFGIEPALVLRLNMLRDSLQLIDDVERRINSLAEAEMHQEQLKSILETGFHSRKLLRLIDRLNNLIHWKQLYSIFTSPAEPFALTRLVNGNYLLATHMEIEAFLNPKDPSIVTPEISAAMQAVRADYEDIRSRLQQSRPTDDVLLKIDLCKLICARKMMDPDIKSFLLATCKEVSYYVEVLSLMGTIQGWQYQLMSPEKHQETLKLYMANGSLPKHATWLRFSDHIRRMSELLLGVSEPLPNKVYRVAATPQFQGRGPLLDNITQNLERLEFINTPVHRALTELRREIQELVDQGTQAVGNDDEARITHIEARIKEYHIEHEIQQELVKSLECFKWRRETDELITELDSKDPSVAEIASTVLEVVARLGQDEACDIEAISRAYKENKAALEVLFLKGKEIVGFYKFEKLSKLISEEKSYRESNKNRVFREKLKQMKESIEGIDANLHSDSNHTREELLVMMYLGYIGLAYGVGIRTGSIISILDKVSYAVACETESETYTFTIEQIKDRIQNFKQLKIWTPFYASLTFLEEWYKRLKEVSQRVIAKVTKIRLIHRSRLVDKMMNSADFELRVNCEGCEITVKKTNRDRGYIQNRSKRDKKKNPYLANGINLGLMDHKPTKQNKELIEEIDFNDYEEKAELLCFCNRPSFDKMIQCNTCEEWYHVDCLKLNKTSLNKIKNLRCPTCSLCHNSSFKRLVLEHQSERATYDEFAELVRQINIIKAHVQLGNQELDILDYHRTYTLIRHQSVEHIKELEGYLESGEAGFEQEFFRDRMDNILIPNLQNSLKMLLGLPFYCEDILHIVLILRKQKLYSTIFNAKCAKKLHPLDLMAIENLAVDIEIGSQPMEQFVQFAQLALKKLSTIEEAEMKRLPYEEFKRVFDEHCSPIKDIGIVDRQQLALEEWPAYRDHLKAKMENLKNLTLKFYQEETHNLATAFPFTSELEELIRKRYELVNDWKIKVKHQLGQQTLNRAYLATLQEQVQGILSPSEGDLSNLNTYLQFNTANNLQQPAAN